MTENEAIKIINDKYETFFALSTTNDFDMAMATAIQALEEIQQYRAIGTVEGYENAIKAYTETYILMKEYKSKLQDFEAIGTVEEFKDLKEKSVARKIRGTRFEEAICPRCESELFDTYWAFGGIHYCSNCGQAIDWQ